MKNDWEEASVLLGTPTADISVAPLADFNWDALLGDVLHVIPDNAETRPFVRSGEIGLVRGLEPWLM